MNNNRQEALKQDSICKDILIKQKHKLGKSTKIKLLPSLCVFRRTNWGFVCVFVVEGLCALPKHLKYKREGTETLPYVFRY